MTFLDILIFWALTKLASSRFGASAEPPTPAGRPPRVPPPRTPTTSRRPTVTPTTSFTPPWPQVVPSGLPPFPGAGWVPDEPPPPDVVTRANMLLPTLWKGGPGTFKVEKTAGRWIVYRATPMGEKRGVVAFRESQHASFLTPAPSPTLDLDEPATQTASTRRVVPATSATSATSLPTLRNGSRGNDVVILQRALGIPADGAFGPQTERAVRAYQSAHGLKPDGIVGPMTWGVLLGKAA